MPHFDHTREKFWFAVEALATSSAPMKNRLYAAAQFLFHGLCTEELPEELRDKFDDLIRELTREKTVGDVDAMRVTIGKMSSTQRDKLAKRIFDLHIAVRGGI